MPRASEPTLQTPAAAETDRPGVGARARALAGATDLAVGLLAAAVLVLSTRLLTGAPPTRSALVWTALFAFELALVGTTLSLFFFGRTPGLALAGLRVEELGGFPIRFQRATVRTLVSIASLALPGVPLLVAAIREDGRSSTDLASGTEIRPESEPATAERS